MPVQLKAKFLILEVKPGLRSSAEMPKLCSESGLLLTRYTWNTNTLGCDLPLDLLARNAAEILCHYSTGGWAPKGQGREIHSKAAGTSQGTGSTPQLVSTAASQWLRLGDHSVTSICPREREGHQVLFKESTVIENPRHKQPTSVLRIYCYTPKTLLRF